MAHPNYRSFCVELSPEMNEKQQNEFQEFMNDLHDALAEHVEEVAKGLEISTENAGQIIYLRGRSRWTQELEDRIVVAMKAGHSIICTMGEEGKQLEDLGF